MSDPNMSDFYDRVRRYEAMRHQGYVPDATGTLSPPARRRRGSAPRRRSVLGPVLVVLLGGFVLKGAILQSIGPETYQSRVDRLMAGQGLDRVGGWLMQADPVTRFVAGQIAHGLQQLNS